MQLFKQIIIFICQLLKENLVIQLMIDLKMHYFSSDHDQITEHTQRNTHHALAHLFHFNNFGSFHDLANEIL
jgi:hypothetical protein